MLELGAQPAQQVENLRLRRHVEARRRLVEHDQLGVAGERHRDHDALLLTAGELVWILARRALRIRKAHVRDQLANAAAARSAPRLADGVHRHRLGELVADAQPGR